MRDPHTVMYEFGFYWFAGSIAAIVVLAFIVTWWLSRNE